MGKPKPKAKVKAKTPKKCDMCFGRGWDENKDDPCIYCKGSGKYKDKVVKK